MSFHLSANSLSLSGTILQGNLQNAEGQAAPAQIDLNTILGNNNGGSPSPYPRQQPAEINTK
jgi:hypothetical protein